MTHPQPPPTITYPNHPAKDHMTYVLNTTRADDEVLLDMLRRRDRGESAAEIGRVYGKTRNAIIHQWGRIRKDDIAHDPAAAAYWHPNGDPT